MGLELVGSRFRLVGAIGNGNMGEVYRAEDLEAAEDSPSRTVAVKMILRTRSGAVAGSQTDGQVERFRREVRIMRKSTTRTCPASSPVTSMGVSPSSRWSSLTRALLRTRNHHVNAPHESRNA